LRYAIDGSAIPETAEELEEAFAQEPAGPLQPVPFAELLDDVREAYCRYIGFASQAQSVALTLWTAHTHALEAADCTPYIRVYSAEKESGKTRTEEVAFHLVHGGSSSLERVGVGAVSDDRRPSPDTARR
jgi:hypothetical protein